ncbi:diguanylate cyclase [Aliiglaciecola sp. CAU 1673]|nr:diguanylate cyclase [Aliiglaciecola sp. CAU 1673]
MASIYRLGVFLRLLPGVAVLLWGMLFPVHAQSLTDVEAQLTDMPPAEQLTLLQQQQAGIPGLPLTDQARFWFLLGNALDVNQQTEQAIDAYSRAIALYEAHQLPLTETLPLSYVERSYMRYLQTNDPQVYCPDRVKALALARELDEPKLLVKILTQNAFCYSADADQLNQGLALLVEAINVAERYQLPKNQYGMIHNASGNLYRRNQILDKAYEFILKAYQAWAEVDDYQDMFNMQHTLVELAIALRQFDKAAEHVQVLYSLAQEQPQFKDFLFFAYFNDGMLVLAQGKPDKAADILMQALLLRDTTQETFFIKRAQVLLVQALFKANKPAEVKKVLTQLAIDWPDTAQWPKEVQGIAAYYQGKPPEAMQLMMTALDEAVQQRREFVTQYQRASTLLFDESITALDNKILQQQLEIQQLELSREQTQRRVAQITVLFSVVALLGLSVFAWYLIKTRRLFRHRAQTDYLTQVANRRSIFEQGHALVRQWMQSQKPLSVLIFDVDHFKQVNDNLGHEQGDKALKLVTQRAKGCLRQQDRIGRIGGEEFMVLLPDTDSKQAAQIAQRIRQDVEKAPLRKDDADYRLTISIGSATLMPGETLEVAMVRADKALYQAKEGGRNQVVMAV